MFGVSFVSCTVMMSVCVGCASYLGSLCLLVMMLICSMSMSPILFVTCCCLCDVLHECVRVVCIGVCIGVCRTGTNSF